MSNKKIQVELDEDIARSFMKDDAVGGEALINRNHIRDAIEAALPPEYPEGTVAWVHCGVGEDSHRYLCVRNVGEWYHGMRRVADDAVTKVEPLRVLADDEVAVKRGSSDHVANWQGIAENCRVAGFSMAAALCRRYDDALEAEATS